ncbi:ImmA/IrrE family metallo-endopeptidase [Micromonospora echinofusca]|uniref:ImmA/IrrE family metallo-endopeptidase n=1 Tax=Micromonospora echinofusca TaxID=47858 RepID=UPI0033F8E673
MLTPSRLVVARKRRRMTLAQLAVASGVSVRSITAFENGHKQPSSDTLEALATAMSFPRPFFEGPPIDEIPIGSVSFRALSKMSALDREAALGAGQVSALINQWNERHFRLPDANVPTLSHLEPEEAAERVRALWGLGEAPIPNMIHLLEANGVRVFSLAADCESIDAYSLRYRGKPFCILNTRKSGERGRFDAAHELGHLVLHADDRLAHGVEAEEQANKFASAFLMPRAGILAQSLHDATPDRILLAKRKWRVAAVALAYRLHDLGLLSEWKYKAVSKRLAQLGFRRGEPGGITRESSQLLGKVFASLRHDPGRISLADELSISTDELNLHVFGLVPIVLDGGRQAGPPGRPQLQLVGARRR